MEEEYYRRRLLDFSCGDVGVWLLRKRGVNGVEDEGGDTAPQDVNSGVKEEEEAMIPAGDDEGSSVRDR